MRGIGLLLMMVGHIPVQGLPHRIIYSFHMPLFFLLSGFFAKDNEMTIGGGNFWNKLQIFNLIRRLLIPFIVTIGIIIGVQYISGREVGHIMGPLWFLLALFWARITYNLIHSFIKKWTLLFAFLLGFVAYVVSIFWMENRIFLIQGLCALPFIAIGKSTKKWSTAKQWQCTNKLWILISIVFCTLCWGLAIAFSHLEMRSCSFGCWPLDIIGACGGTLFLWLISDRLLKYRAIAENIFTKFIIWCGRYSMAVLCMHGLEWKALLPLEQIICDEWILLGLRLIVTFVLATLVIYTPGLRKIFQ